MAFTIDQLSGRAVIASDGHVLGEIDTLLLDSDGGLAIHSIRVKLRKEIAERLGLEHTTFKKATLDIPASSIQSVADTVVLSVPIGELRRAPMPRLDETERALAR